MTGLKSRWFVEIFLDGSTVRFWNDFESVTYDGQTFQPLGDRFTPPDKVKRTATLKSETVKLKFDASRQLDDGNDILADLLDSTWRNRQVRIRNVFYTTTPDAGDVVSDIYGRIRNLPGSLAVASEPTVDMEIESGSLTYLERRMQTRTAENQKLVFPTDQGFDLAKRLEDVPLLWRTKHTDKGSAQPTAPTTKDPAARELPIGEFTTEGSFVAHFTNQQQDKYWHRLYAIADCRIHELNKVWINGKLEISAPLVHGVKTAVPGLDSGGTRCWVTFYDGRDDQTADSELVSVESAWTANHRLRGVAYIHIVHLWDSDLSESFSYKFGGKGAYWYDRRLDSLAGGTGSHSLTDPSTWAYTTNPMVAADHYRQGIRIMSGSSAMWFGVGENADVIPYAEFKDLADLSDENVALKAGGTQKRYEAHGIISAADDHKTNLEKLAGAMSARAIDTGGRIVFRPVRTQTPVLTLIDGDLIAKEQSDFDPAARIGDMANRIEGRFNDRNQDYKAVDYPPVSDAALIASDGETITATKNFELENDGERAQRLATLNLAYLRRIAELSETFLSSKVRTLKPGDWVTRKSAVRGFAAGKLFEVEEKTNKRDGTTEILFVEVDPDQQVWNEATAATVEIPPTVDPVTIVTLDVPSIAVTALSYAYGGVTVPAFKFAHAAYADFIGDEIEIEYGVTAASERYIQKIPGNISTIIALAGAPPSTLIAFRFRARQGERFSAWSAQTNVTSTGAFESATSGVADSLVGQGWGATASESEASNAKVPAGKNSLFYTNFAKTAGFWKWSGSGSITQQVVSTVAGISFYRSTRNALTAGQTFQIDSRDQNALFPVRPGEKVFASAAFSAYGVSQVRIFLQYRDSSGSYIGQDDVTDSSGAWTSGFSGGDASHRISVSGVAPAGTAYADVTLRAYAASSSARLEIARPQIMVARSEQESEPPWSDGINSDPEADVTGDNTAVGISDQGVFATANYYEQSGDPGSVANGSLWFKTTTSELFIRRSGAWGKVADIASALTAVASNDRVEADGTNNYYNFSIPSVTGSGGSGSYSISRKIIVGSSEKWSVSGTTLILNNAGDGDNNAVVRVTVTDNSTGKTAYADIGFSYYYFPF